MQKILMIVNPKAGRAKSKKYVSDIVENLKRNGHEVELEYTTPDRNASQIIKEHKLEREELIVWGGDGTLNETLNGLSETNQDAIIAFIPMGTTNDFARSLKVSFNELDVSKNIDTYKLKEVDMGKIDEKPFNYVVSFGIFSKASYSTSRKWKNRVGKSAYYLNGIKELFNYKTHFIKITSEENNLEGEYLYGSVSNSKYMGGFPVFRKKEVLLDDGKFEVILAKKPKNPLATTLVVLKILTGNLNDKHISYFKTSNIKIDAPNGIDLSIDGEYGGNRKEFLITNEFKKTKYLVPNR